MSEPTVDPVLQSMISAFDGEPSYPSIGTIVKHCANVIGMTEKEQDKGKSFRQTLLRLEKQQPGKIDLDRYQEILWSIIDEYEDLTEEYEFHWLAGSQIFHYLSAYQQLISYYPVIGFTQEEIDSLVGFSFLYWSILRYAWWLKTYTTQATEHALPWWFSLSTNPGDGFSEAIVQLKKLLDDQSMSDWQLIHTIYGNDSLSKEEVSDKIKQLTSWRSGKTAPKYWTIYYQLIKPLTQENSKVAKTFQVDIISWFWVREWVAMISLDPNTVQTRLVEVFGTVLQSEDIMATNIPSKYLMKIGSLHQSLAVMVRYLVRDIVKDKDPEAVADLYLRPTVAPICLMEKRELSQLIQVAQKIEYINGNDFGELTEYLFSNLLPEESEFIEPVFKSAYLHGLIKSGFRDAKAWFRYNRSYLQDKDALAKKRAEMLGISPSIESWLHSWDEASINEEIPVGEYNRTRLMVAAFRGDLKLVSKLIRSGCDIARFSKDSEMTMGDNSSALMLALKGYEEPMMFMQRDSSIKVIALLLKEIEKIGKESASQIVNAAHAITKRTPLSVALDLGNLPLAGKLIRLGAKIDLPIGGDSFLPIYEAISAFGNCSNPSRAEQALLQGTNINRFNMESPPELMESIRATSDPEVVMRILKKSMAVTNLHRSKKKSDYLGIIKLLVQAGANINQLNTNGRYPLDLAIEIGDNSLIKVLFNLGAKKRAIF